VEISDERASEYSLISLRAEKGGSVYPDGVAEGWRRKSVSGVEYKLGLDTPTAFALMHNGKPNAIIGVMASKRSNELLICQMQGVKGYIVDPETQEVKVKPPWALEPLDWRQLAVDIATELASDMGMESLAIQGAKNNQWARATMRSSFKILLPKEAAYAAYDAQAERLGFRPSDDDNWHQPIKKSSASTNTRVQLAAV
jgi:hypothetical protein